jgi:putative membrane protein
MKWEKMNLVAMLLALISVTACEDDPEEEIIDINDWNQTDMNFVTNANEGNRAEIEMSALASLKGSAGVKMFSQMMVNEHSDALEELQTIANDQDVQLSTELSAEHKQLKARLEGLSGFIFDTAYINSQVKAHNETLILFDNESSNGDDQRLINYANKYLPIIRIHLKKADSLKVILDNSVTGG